MAGSSYLTFLVVVCCMGAIFSLETLDAKIKVNRKTFNPYTDFKRKDFSEVDVEDEIIDIALGDHRREVWSQIVMTPELKAKKMSLDRKQNQVEKKKMRLHGKKKTPSNKKDASPFDKYLPSRQAKN